MGEIVNMALSICNVGSEAQNVHQQKFVKTEKRDRGNLLKHRSLNVMPSALHVHSRLDLQQIKTSLEILYPVIVFNTSSTPTLQPALGTHVKTSSETLVSILFGDKFCRFSKSLKSSMQAMCFKSLKSR